MTRFIPACAGKAAGPGCPAAPPAVHPRVRGEGVQVPPVLNVNPGSSPRARGRRSRFCTRWPHARFIPACAGKAYDHANRLNSRSVHPRVRGEGHPQRRQPGQSDGSSPRARGRPKRGWARWSKSRFIPACAGKATRRHCVQRQRPVHPRVRGEGVTKPSAGIGGAGSSPRARGRLRKNCPTVARLRFIPACAGKAVEKSLARRFVSVHPRVRGEGITAPLTCGPGSRFIPACAGKAMATASRKRTIAVHPRVRGEGAVERVQLRTHLGSSPRARGRRSLHDPDAHASRFIPACAGKALHTSN